jgi:hypothetical protein
LHLTPDLRFDRMRQLPPARGEADSRLPTRVALTPGFTRDSHPRLTPDLHLCRSQFTSRRYRARTGSATAATVMRHRARTRRSHDRARHGPPGVNQVKNWSNAGGEAAVEADSRRVQDFTPGLLTIHTRPAPRHSGLTPCGGAPSRRTRVWGQVLRCACCFAPCSHHCRLRRLRLIYT